MKSQTSDHDNFFDDPNNPDYYPDSGLEIQEMLLAERSDLNADILLLIGRYDNYKQALSVLERVADLDVRLEGDLTFGSLMKFGDVYAGMNNWFKASEYLITLQRKLEEQLTEFHRKVKAKEDLTEAEKITFGSGTLQALLKMVKSRLPLYKDFGERVLALREFVDKKILQTPEKSPQETIHDLRYKFSLYSLPPPLRPVIAEVIDYIAEDKGINKETDQEAFFKISEIVFAYLTTYFSEIDPENEYSFIEACVECPDEPAFEKSRAARNKNPVAGEARIKNRASYIMRRNRAFIDNNKAVFGALRNLVDEFIRIRNKVANHDVIVGELVLFLKKKNIILK